MIYKAQNKKQCQNDNWNLKQRLNLYDFYSKGYSHDIMKIIISDFILNI